MTRLLHRLAPAALLVTGACFATRNDVRILQEDLAATRAAAARQDSARAAQIAEVHGLLRFVSDSLRTASARLSGLQANFLEDLRRIQEQILMVQELTGQSQLKLNALRADLEQRNQAPAPVTPTTPGDTSRPATSGAPGPNQLFQVANEQIRRGSYAAARSGFEELLRSYPTSDLAPDAQFYIAESYAGEGNAAAADSVYLLVVEKYPRSPRAASSLYKHALVLQRTGKMREAKEALQRVVRTYPRTDEARLAEEVLRTLP